MIQWLADLPKIVDAFIVGVIEFFYRFVGAVLNVCWRPFSAAQELEQNEQQLSSRTMLFGSVALFVLGAFIKTENAGAQSGAGLLNFMVLAVLFYVGIDATADGWRAVLRRPSRRHRPRKSA